MNTFWIIAVIWCSPLLQPVLMQVVKWESNTPEPFCGNEIELRCTVTNYACCTSLTRTWTRIVSGVSTVILSNGGTNFPLKYEERSVDNTGFSLFIKNWDEKDVDIDYSCLYGTSFQTKLSVNTKFTCPAIKPDKCPMQYDTVNKKIVGTIYSEKLTPSPSIAAGWGEKNLTADLVVVGPSAISGYPNFYAINASLNKEEECFYSPKFTLTVTTGKTKIYFCTNEDICKCGECIGRNFGWSMVMPCVSAVIVIVFSLTLFCKKECSLAVLTTNRKIAAVLVPLGLSIVLCIIPAAVVAYTLCHCINFTDPLFILQGAAYVFLQWTLMFLSIGFFVIKKMKKQGSTVNFECPHDNSDQWQRFDSDEVKLISDGDTITDSKLKDKASIVIDPTTGKQIFQLKNLQKSDEGVYRCGKWYRGRFYRLELSEDDDSAVSDAPSNGTHSSNSGAQPKGKATKTPTNKRDKKPEAKHVKTESLEKERSYADDKHFESNLNKVPPGRPLPSLNPRSLPVPTKPDPLPPINKGGD